MTRMDCPQCASRYTCVLNKKPECFSCKFVGNLGEKWKESMPQNDQDYIRTERFYSEFLHMSNFLNDSLFWHNPSWADNGLDTKQYTIYLDGAEKYPEPFAEVCKGIKKAQSKKIQSSSLNSFNWSWVVIPQPTDYHHGMKHIYGHFALYNDIKKHLSRSVEERLDGFMKRNKIRLQAKKRSFVARSEYVDFLPKEVLDHILPKIEFDMNTVDKLYLNSIIEREQNLFRRYSYRQLKKSWY